MTVLYSLVLLFTVDGHTLSESSQHSLSQAQCLRESLFLTNGLSENPPFLIRGGEQIVMTSSKPTYVCVPTSIK